MTKRIFTLLLTLLTIHVGYSQNIDSEKLDKYFQTLDTNNKFMGSVAILKRDKIIYTNQIGYSDIETQKKPTENTKYRIGSISKTFTATLIFKAIEEGRLEIDQTIIDYFPNIENAEKIKIKNLLNHSSGIHNFTDDSEYLTYNTQAKTEQEMLNIIVSKGSDFTPNSKSQYSNSNYVLLSYIVEKAYEKSYSQILNDKIIAPLNLKNTYFGSKINLDNNECNSYSYNIRNWEKRTETDMTVPMGAGAIISTPSDLLLFSRALFTGEIITEKSVNEMKTLKDNYGMGLFQIPFQDKVSYGHTGGIDGFTSVFGYFQDEEYGFALTSNGSNYDDNEISIAILSAIFNKPYEIPSFKTYDLTSEDLDKYLGVYSSEKLPFKITITKIENKLMAQATGQSAFGLDATKKDIFKFDQAGIMLEFTPSKNEVILNQGGGSYILIKDK